MAKIPFDVKYRPQVESGEYKVETRDGLPARIICWDKKEYADQRETPTPIVYLVLTKGGCEHTLFCTTGGTCPDDLKRDYDLFVITPDPELTEFEKAIKDLCSRICWDTQTAKPGERIFDNNDIKVESTRLLDLAKKELKSPWIPASNPPETERPVITCRDIEGIPSFVCISYHNKRAGVWVDFRDQLVYADYWMESPELPKEDEK